MLRTSPCFCGTAYRETRRDGDMSKMCAGDGVDAAAWEGGGALSEPRDDKLDRQPATQATCHRHLRNDRSESVLARGFLGGRRGPCPIVALLGSVCRESRMSELGRIADNADDREAFIKFWGDRYVESRAALETMRTLMVARLHTVAAEIERVKTELRLKGEGETDG